MRLIDADALLEKLNKEKVPYRRDIDKVIREMTVYAPIINKPQWIPVTERMPEENVSVLATVSVMPSTNVTLYKTVVIAEYFGNEGWYVEGWPEWEDASPDYWMPLPEAYEPDGAKMDGGVYDGTGS